MGNIYLIALNELKHANAGTSPVSITVYAWMEDVKLSSPTILNPSYIVSQAGGDEYGDGLVSMPASAVARMSGKLSSTPIIGKYMKATSVASGAVASVAKMFGMSRPTLIESPQMMLPRYVSGFAVTDVADPACKLTVDSKQELTIDSAVTGADGGDEMSLKHLASIESYLTTFAWNVVYTPGTILFAARPCPQHFYRAGTPAYTTVPACGFVANAFKYWRGTMRYRFQVVSSGFHKGRLLVVWDPAIGATTPETNVQFSKIMDISNERDVTIEIGWGQNTTWLETNNLANAYYTNNALTYTTLDTTRQTNGVVTVYVLNDLTTPNSVVNNDIQVNVFVSMCSDAEFAVPSDRIKTYSPYTQGVAPQAGGDLEVKPENNLPVMEQGTEKIADCVDASDPTDLVYIGESVNSFRQLIKRYNLHYIIGNIAATAGYFQWNTTDFPINRGYYANGLRTGSTLTYNPTNNTMLNYMTFAFTAFRGGIRNKIIAVSSGTNATLATSTISRNVNTTMSIPALTATTSSTQVLFEDQAMSLNSSGLEGLHMTPTGVQPVLEVEYPFYNNARFAACRIGYSPPANFVSTASLTHKFSAFATNQPTQYQVYVSGAEDCTFSMFQGCIPFQVSPTFS